MALARAWKKSAAVLVVAAIALPCPASAVETGAIEGTEPVILYTVASGRYQYCWKRWTNLTDAGGYPYYGWFTGPTKYTDAWYLDIFDTQTGTTQRRARWIQLVHWTDEYGDPTGASSVQCYISQGTNIASEITLSMNGGAFPDGTSTMAYDAGQSFMNAQYGATRDVPDGNCTPGDQVTPPPPPDDGAGDPLGPCDAPSDPRYDGNENAINYIALNGGIYETYTWKKRTTEDINYGSSEAWVLYHNNVTTEWRMESVQQPDGSYKTLFYNVLGTTIKVLANTIDQEKGASIPWFRALNEMASRYGAARDQAADGNCTFGNQFNVDPALDTDGDGIPDIDDADDDGDGEGDDVDPCPTDKECTSENHDTDGDGVPDAEDTDDDGDNVPDEIDTSPRDHDDYGDCDGDGMPNKYDLDDDNDGIPDAQDSKPCGKDADCDNDKIPDVTDPDDDNDGCPDQFEPPGGICNPAIKCNCDNDSKIDPIDEDDDNDGCPDASDPDPCNPEIRCEAGELFDAKCPGSQEFSDRLDEALDGWKSLGIDLTALSGNSVNGKSWRVSVPIPGVGDRDFYLGTYLDNSHWASSAVETGRAVLRAMLLVVLAISFTARIIKRLGSL